MPRYYFHVRLGKATILDHQGVELADLTEAVKEALRRKSTVMEGASLSSGVIMVEDECSTPLLIPFGDDELLKAPPDGE